MRAHLGPLVALLFAGALVGCPGARSDGGGAPGGASASAPAPFPAGSGKGRSALPESANDEITAGVPLRAGEALPSDVAPSDAEVAALETEWVLRRQVVVPGSQESVFAARGGAIVARFGDGRASLRLEAGAFALPEGSELRLARGWVGAIWLPSKGASTANGYRVIPPGALRTFVSEGRADVLPFGPTRVLPGAAGEALGRAFERVTIVTPYGRVVLDQIAAPKPSPRAPAPSGSIAPASSGSLAPVPSQTSTPPVAPAPSGSLARGDAGRPLEAGVELPPQLGLDGAGEPFCRAILELVASDRALGGAPCDADHVPIRAEISWTIGGGLLLEATAVRERPLPRAELAFPPTRARLLPPPTLADAALFSREAPPDAALIELIGAPLALRVVVLDGAVAGWIGAGKSLSIPARRGRHRIEWQTALGEQAEAAIEVDAPARVVAGQASPLPLPSASAIASARTHP